MTGSSTKVRGVSGALALVALLAACQARDEAAPGMEGTVMDTGQQQGMDRPGMQPGRDMLMGGMMGMDPAMMTRHADEADTLAARMREHLAAMRALTAEQQHERMGEHVRELSGMLGLMDRHMREMSMGMTMSDEQMGAMMGMSADEHRQMMEEMGALRADLEGLQRAPVGDVRQRMSAHLERCERMVEMLGHGAQRMREMGRGG